MCGDGLIGRPFNTLGEETNANAVRLYASEGFTLDRVVSTAYATNLAALA